MVGQIGDAAVAMVTLVGAYFFCSAIAGAIREGKGDSFGSGFFYGLLGVFGILLSVVVRGPSSPSTPIGMPTRECPFCLQQIPAAAPVCAWCTRESRPWHSYGGPWWVKSRTGQWFYLDPTGRQWVPSQDTPEDLSHRENAVEGA